eukprot:CAMPEP_0176291314 /NCGR_PEP_ID=MMETSP0121_2-20121125/55481_1 /TAXON_ID=160619 /ORGANISM="Kryptoperidinium foliaceum, Strain CCMP 1326" /LENGTH=65 /DNA_ID=CAMNT_0017632145 /DNA_START=64 /DNA_END=258 /DNA_ORIENTATION=-
MTESAASCQRHLAPPSGRVCVPRMERVAGSVLVVGHRVHHAIVAMGDFLGHLLSALFPEVREVVA